MAFLKRNGRLNDQECEIKGKSTENAAPCVADQLTMSLGPLIISPRLTVSQKTGRTFVKALPASACCGYLVSHMDGVMRV
jgi:hypothetical protein